jgi:F-type H+-transporting ATPase subunit b
MLEFDIVEIGIHILNVLILFFILRKVLYKPITNYMKKREESFAKKIDDLDAREKEVIQQKELYERLMAESDAKAAEIINRSSEMANENANEIINYAKEHAKDLVVRARNEIEVQKLQTQSDLRVEITNMAVSLAEKVLEREISAEDNRKVIGEFFERVG